MLQKKYTMVTTLMIFLVVFGFSVWSIYAKDTTGTEEQNKESKVYISFLETRAGPADKMKSRVYHLDISSDKVTKRGIVPYFSQYPLAVFSESKNKIFFSMRAVEFNPDQLCEYDLETKEKKELTKDIFAINYIVPYKDSIYMVAVRRGSPILDLLKYEDGKTETLFADKDETVRSLGYNPETQDLVFATESEKEFDRRIEENRPAEQCYPPNTIWKLNLNDDANIKKVYRTKSGFPRCLYPDSRGKIYIVLGGKPMVIDKGKIRKNNELKNFASKMTDMMYMNDNYIYYNTGRGIYKYDRIKKKRKCLFKLKYKKALINSSNGLTY